MQPNDTKRQVLITLDDAQFKVQIIPQSGAITFDSLEEALRRVITGLGLEYRDVIVFDGIPGIVT